MDRLGKKKNIKSQYPFYCLFRLVGRFLNNLFGRPSNRTTHRPSFGPLNFRIQPLITQSPRKVSSSQLANQLLADGATGLDANQVDGDGIRDIADVADIVDPDVENGFKLRWRVQARFSLPWIREVCEAQSSVYVSIAL
jgi:hypothetical protein